ncbi:integrase, catalytic region, zinc finger, CCHC-type containing protein [Tanacetum coccineum]
MEKEVDEESKDSEEEIEEETKEEEEDDPEYFDTFPTIEELVEDTTSVIDHYLGGMILGKPFVKESGLIYDKDERTVTFEKDKERIMFKMPHKMERFKHIDKEILKTDNIPPFIITGDDSDQEKTHYLDILNLGLTYRRDKNITKSVQFLIKMKSLPKMKFEKDHLCSACEQGKIHQKHHKSKTDFALNKPLYLLHMDLCGPMRVESINGNRYVLVVVDDYSRCYLLNDYDDVRKLKAKGDIGVFVGYLKEFAVFRVYNKQTRKIHESVNVNFDEISEMASKQFSLEPRLSNLNETGKSSNPTVSQVSEISKKDLEDLFHNFYNEYFDSSKITKSPTTNDETSNTEIPSHEEEVFHEVSESFQEESSSSSLKDDVQQTSEEVMVSPTNTQSISNNMVPNVHEASSSHNVFNEWLEDAYFDASTTFHDPSNVHTFYQPYPHEKNIEPANVAEDLKDADWASAMQDELDQFARLKVWRLVPRPEGKTIIKTK